MCAIKFVSFPVLQQFGLIYYDRLLGMGMPNAEITTLINTQLSLNCCVGKLIYSNIFATSP